MGFAGLESMSGHRERSRGGRGPATVTQRGWRREKPREDDRDGTPPTVLRDFLGCKIVDGQDGGGRAGSGVIKFLAPFFARWLYAGVVAGVAAKHFGGTSPASELCSMLAITS